VKMQSKLRSVVRLTQDVDAFDFDFVEKRHSVPQGALIFVVGYLDENPDNLHRFIGLWGGNLLKFYLFSSEVRQL